MSQVTVNGVRTTREVGPVTFSRIFVGEYQKDGTKSAEIRQTIVTKSFYPSKRVETNLNMSLFEAKDFGFTEKEFTNTENRVAWILVPAAIKQEEVEKRIQAAVANGACIYKVLSNVPILDDNQKYAIEAGQKTMDDFANTQIVRFPDNHETKAGQICLDQNGKPQYRRTFFWATKMDDQDARNSDPSFFYISPEIEQELAGSAVYERQVL